MKNPECDKTEEKTDDYRKTLSISPLFQIEEMERNRWIIIMLTSD
jgi:hypothetical protein